MAKISYLCPLFAPQEPVDRFLSGFFNACVLCARPHHPIKRDVSALKDFTVPFQGLALGHHRFEWMVNNAFLAEFPFALMQNANVRVHLALERNEHALDMHFELSGEVGVECDRCLNPLHIPVQATAHLIARLTDQDEPPETDDDELLLLPKAAYELDLSTYVYETVSLQLPLRTGCEAPVAGRCNLEMIALLDKYKTSAQAEGDDATSADDAPTDPRWDALKKLKQN